MNKLLIGFWLIISATATCGQELFIHAEPASSIPKGIFSVRYSMESYEYENIRRHWHAFRLFYGLTPNFTIAGTISASNHHQQRFPSDPWAYFNNHHNIGYSRNYPFKFEGFHLYGKYRLITVDEKNGHLRIAVFGEASTTRTAHDEAEPHLMGDNSGIGGGVIITKLVKKFAISATAGTILPSQYTEPEKSLTFRSGKARYVMVSAGYLLYPKMYKTYSDLNVNIYLETLLKEYDPATLHLNQKYEFVDNFFYLRGGKYLEARPGIQFIVNSDTRIDLSFAVSVFGKSFIRNNPTIFVGYQKYLFR